MNPIGRGRAGTWVSVPGREYQPVDRWARAGREHARMLLGEGVSSAELLQLARSRSRFAFDSDEVIAQLTAPKRYEETVKRRTAFTRGVVDVAIQAGGLQLGRPSHDDLCAPVELVAEERLRS